MAQIKLAEYTFDNSVGDVMPLLTPNTITMTTEDTVDGIITRRIVYIDNTTMPTKLSFGKSNSYNDSLLTVEYLNIDSNLTSLDMCFYRCRTLQRVNTSNWDTSNVSNFTRFCDESSSLVEIDVSHFNVAKANGNFYKMFSGVKKAEVLDVSKWNVNTTDGSLGGMFENCSSVKALDLSNWKMKIVHTTGTDTGVYNMFSGCSSLEYLDLSGFDFSEMNASMSNMFKNCSSLREIKGIENFNVSKVAYFSFMFQGCSSLTSLNLSNWNTGSATTFQGMFHSCTSLTEIKGIENFNVSKSTTFGSMFYNCSSLTSLDLRNWVTSSATSFQDMFSECRNLEVIRVDNFDTSKVTGTGLNGMFSLCQKVKTLNLNSFVNGGLGNFLHFCSQCVSLEYVSAQNFVWGKCSAIQGAFTNCKSLKMLDFTNFDGTTISTTTTSLRLSGFNTLTCPIYYDSSKCTQYDTGITSLPNAVDVQGRLMAIYTFDNSVGDCTVETSGVSTNNYAVTDTVNGTTTKRIIAAKSGTPTGYSFYNQTSLLTLDFLNICNNVNSMNTMFQGCSNLTFVEASNWDTSSVTDMSSIFNNCSNLQTVDVSKWNTSKVTNMAHMFRYCPSLATVDVSEWDTSSVGNMTDMFHNCTNLTTIDVSNWNTSNVWNMDNTFKSCSKLQTLDVSKWDTSKVELMRGMFHGCSLTTLDVSEWDTSSVTRMDNMFNSCPNLQTLDLSNWDTSSVTNMDNMFYKCSNLQTLKWTNWLNSVNLSYTQLTQESLIGLVKELGKVTEQTLTLNATLSAYIEEYDFVYADILGWTITPSTTFSYANIKASDDISGVNNSTYTMCAIEVTDSNRNSRLDDVVKAYTSCNTMFLYSDDSLVSLGSFITDTNNTATKTKIKNLCFTDSFNTSNVTSMGNLLNGCTNLTTLDVSHLDTSKVANMSSMFNNCYKLTTIDVSKWDTKSVTNMSYMFNNCSNLTTLDVSNWDTSKVTNMRNMFYGCAKLTTIDVSKWDTSSVDNMTNIFSNCSNLQTLDVSKWVTSKVVNMTYVFSNCTSLQTLDVSKWNTSRVTDMHGTFYGCSKLQNLDVSKWVTSSVTNMNNIFNNCSSLQVLDVSKWDTSKVSNVSAMFAYCTNLTTLDVSKWDTSSVTNMNSTFNNCSKLQTLDISKWNTSKVTTTDSTFKNCTNLQTLKWTNWLISVDLSTTNLTQESLIGLIYRLGNATEQTLTLNDTLSGYLKDVEFTYADIKGWTITPSTATTISYIDIKASDDISGVNDSAYNTCIVEITESNKYYRLDDVVKAYTSCDTMFLYSDNSLISLNLFISDTNNTTARTKLKNLCFMDNFNTSNVTNTGNMLNGCSNLQTLVVSHFDTSKVTAMNNMFSNCSNLQILDVSNFDTKSATAINGMFYSCAKLTTLDVSNFDTSKVINMSYMFTNCAKLTTLDVSNFDTSKVTSFAYMFNSCSNLATLDVSNFDTLSVSNMAYMFENCTNLQTLDVSKWNTSNVSNMGAMFNNCKNLTTLDVSDWNTSKVTNMVSMFNSCTNLQTLDVSNWDTSKVTGMNNMFLGCSSLTTLNVSNWDTSKVTNVSSVFNGCSSLQNLDVSNWDTSLVTNMNYLFNSCSSLQNLDVSNWDTSLVTAMNGVFYGCSKLTTLDVSDWKTSNATGMNNMFSNCSKLTTLDVSNFDTSKVTNIGYVFNGCTNLYTLNVGDWDTSKVTEMGSAFRSCPRLTTLDISNWDTSSVTNMSFMFDGCSSLRTLDIGNWDVSNVDNMNNMFSKCTKLRTLDINNWKTSSVTNMRYIFNNCINLTTLDLNNWDTSSVTNMSCMFHGCSKLQALNVSKWDTSSATNMEQAFRYCGRLTTLDLNGWDTSNVGNMSFMFENCPNLTTLDISNFDTSKVTNMGNMFNSSHALKTIGMLYSNTESINKLVQIYRPNGLVVYYYDADPTQLTPVTGVTFEKYIMPTTIQLPPHIQLHSLPDGTRDELDLKTGILTRNVGCYDMIKVNDDRTKTYYILDEEIIEKVKPRITDAQGNEITLANFLNTSIDSPLVNKNTTCILDSNNKLTEAKATTDDYGKLDDYYVLFNPKSRQLTLADLSVATQATYSDGGSKGILITHSGSPNLIRFKNVGLELEVGKTYTIKVEIESKSYCQQVHYCRMINPSDSDDYVNIFTDLDDTNLDGSLVLRDKYTHQNANYSTLSISVIGGLSDTNTSAMGSYYIKVTIFEGDSEEKNGLAYKNIGLNSILNYKDELNLITGEITRRIGVRDYKQGEECNMLPTITFDSYITYKKEKIMGKLPTPTTEKIILNYNNSCDYGLMLPTGMCDKYDVVNSMYTKTMTSILLDGANAWDAMEEFKNTIKFTATGTTVGVENLNMLGAGGLYCDNGLFPNINDDSDVEHCRVDKAGNKFYIYISKDRLMSPDLIGWQIWLQTNKFNMTYELAEHLTYAKPYEELDPTQARWEGMDCIRDGAIRYHTNNSDKITIYPTLEYIAPSNNSFKTNMLKPNIQYSVYAQNPIEGQILNLGGNPVEFTNGATFTSGTDDRITFDNAEFLDKVVIVEGDVTNESVPYFTGMRSVKTPVLTTVGKNLFDVPDITILPGMGGNSLNALIMNFVLKPNTTYSLSKEYTKVASSDTTMNAILMPSPLPSHLTTNNMIVNYANNDGKRINWLTTNKFTTDSTRIYLTLLVDGGAGNTIKNVQLEEGSTITEYEPHKSNILTVNEPIELRGIGDIKDELNLETGEFIQRIGEIVLDGSESWYPGVTVLGNYNRFSMGNVQLPLTQTYGVCDKVLYKATADESEHIYVSNSGLVSLFLSNTKASTSTELKTYLSTNPITVQYPLAEPIVRTIDSTWNLCQHEKFYQAVKSLTSDTLNVYTSSDTQAPVVDLECSTGSISDVEGEIENSEAISFTKAVLTPPINVTIKNPSLTIMGGKNFAPNSPIEATDTVRGVTFSSDGNTISMQGTNTSYVGYDLANQSVSVNLVPHAVTATVTDYYKNKKISGAGSYTLSANFTLQFESKNMNIISICLIYDDNKMASLGISSAPTTDLLRQTTFTAEKYVNGIYLSIWYSGYDTSKISVKNIQLEKGGVVTEYEPHSSIKFSANEEITLRAVGEFKDSVDLLTGRLSQGIGEIILDGNQNYVIDNTYNGDTATYIQAVLTTSTYSTSAKHENVTCDTLQVIPFEDLKNTSGEWVTFRYPAHGRIFIQLLKSNLSSATVNGIKEYFSNNITKIHYALQTSVIKKVEIVCDQLQFKAPACTNAEYLQLSSDNGILPTMHYAIPSRNSFYLPSIKTGTLYTLKYPVGSGTIRIGNISYNITSDSMLFTTPLSITGDKNIVIFPNDDNPQDVILLEGSFRDREIKYFTGMKSVVNPTITIQHSLTGAEQTYKLPSNITLRSLPNGVADTIDIINGRLTQSVGYREYQDGDNELQGIYTDGYHTVYGLPTPTISTIVFPKPTVNEYSIMKLSSDELIPQLTFRALSSNHFPLDLLEPNATYTLKAKVSKVGSFTLGGTYTNNLFGTTVIPLKDTTNNSLIFDGDLGASEVVLVKGDVSNLTVPYFSDILSVNNGTISITGKNGELNTLSLDDNGIVLRSCDTYTDTINLTTGVLTIRTGETTFKGIEDWQKITNDTVGYSTFRLTLQGVAYSNNRTIICNRFKHKYDAKAEEGVYAYNNSININVKESTIGGDTVDAFKLWLGRNNVTVVYRLSNPLEIPLTNVWTTMPPTSYEKSTTITTVTQDISLKPILNATVAITTLEQIAANLEAQNIDLQQQNESLDQENVATMLALTDLYETMVAPMAVMSLNSDPYAMSTMSLDDEEPATNVVGYTVSPMGMIYAKLVHRGLKTMYEVPYNLQVEVMYALKGME